MSDREQGTGDPTLVDIPRAPVPSFDGMSKMLLVEEGVPLWLSNLINTLDINSLSKKKDAFTYTFCVILYECGFQLRDEVVLNSTYSFDIRVMHNLPQILGSLKESFGKYLIQFRLGQIPNAVDVVIDFLDSWVLTNLLEPDGVTVHSLVFQLSDFVSAPGGPIELTNLDKLSGKLKPLLFSVKCNVMTANSLQFDMPYIMSIPPEVLLTISKLLDVKSYGRFSLTCKELYDILTNDESQWKKFFRRHYNNMQLPYQDPNDSWRSKCIECIRAAEKNPIIVRRSQRCPSRYLFPFPFNNQDIVGCFSFTDLI